MGESILAGKGWREKDAGSRSSSKSPTCRVRHGPLGSAVESSGGFAVVLLLVALVQMRVVDDDVGDGSIPRVSPSPGPAAPGTPVEARPDALLPARRLDEDADVLLLQPLGRGGVLAPAKAAVAIVWPRPRQPEHAAQSRRRRERRVERTAVSARWRLGLLRRRQSIVVYPHRSSARPGWRRRRGRAKGWGRRPRPAYNDIRRGRYLGVGLRVVRRLRGAAGDPRSVRKIVPRRRRRQMAVNGRNRNANPRERRHRLRRETPRTDRKGRVAHDGRGSRRG